MLITEKEFAEIIGIKHNSLAIKRIKGEINFYQKIGRFYYYEKEDCLNFCKTYVNKNPIYEIDLNYFKKIDTEHKAYFLGLLYADGGNTGNSVVLGLKEEDKHILKDFKKQLSSNKPIPTYITKTTKYCRFDISHKSMVKDLENLGIVRRKSLKIKFPTFINENLINHFIRGYFDGDGCLSWNKNNYYSTTVSIVSTLDFLNGLLPYINNLNINSGIYNISSLNNNNITKRFVISGWNQCKTFLDYIYKDSNIFLHRKFNKYKLIQDIKSKKIAHH